MSIDGDEGEGPIGTLKSPGDVERKVGRPRSYIQDAHGERRLLFLDHPREVEGDD